MGKIKLEDVIECIKNDDFGKDLKDGEELFILYQTGMMTDNAMHHGCMLGSKENMVYAFAVRMFDDEDFRSIIFDALNAYTRFINFKLEN